MAPAAITRSTALLAALALSLLGCSVFGEPVALLTGDVLPSGACYTNGLEGVLISDPDNGTALAVEPQGPFPVMWLPGFTARRYGAEVRVLGTDGNVVAVTGRRYYLAGAVWDNNGFGNQVDLNGNPQVFWACGDVLPME